MFDKLDAHSVKAVLAAEEESRRSGHKFVDTEQLLIGLMSDGDSVSARILHKLGLKHQFVRKRTLELLGQGTDVVGVETPFTPRMKELLERAWIVAQDCGSEMISPRDLLRAFAQVNDGIAGQILSEAGISPEVLSKEV